MALNNEGYDGKSNLLHINMAKGLIKKEWTNQEQIEHLQSLLRNRDAYIETIERINEDLKTWKEGAILSFKKWDALIDFAQGSKLFTVGDDIPSEVLRLLKCLEDL